MKLPVDMLSGLIVETLRQVRDGICRARTQGIADVDVGEQLQITVELIAPAGVNALERKSVQTTTPRETQEISPSVTELAIEDPVETVNVEDGFTARQTEVVQQEESNVYSTTDPVTTVTEEDASTDHSDTTQESTATQGTGSALAGRDVTTTDYTVEEL